MDVVVNLPGRDVALLFLSVYEETLWHIGWTEGTRIKTVALVKLPGGEKQILAGLPPGIPTYILDSADGSCTNLKPFSKFPSALEPQQFEWQSVLDAASKLLGTKATAMFTFQDGSNIVTGRPLQGGERILTSATEPEQFVDRTALSPERLALEESVDSRILDYAAHADAQTWLEAAKIPTPTGDNSEMISPKGRMRADGALYIVRRHFALPRGLEEAVSIIVPRGVPTPSGEVKGEVAIYDVENGSCIGGGNCSQLMQEKTTSGEKP